MFHSHQQGEEQGEEQGEGLGEELGEEQEVQQLYQLVDDQLEQQQVVMVKKILIMHLLEIEVDIKLKDSYQFQETFKLGEEEQL